MSNEVIIQTDAYFGDLPKSYFLDGLKKLEKRFEKCLELKGDYVEKQNKKSTQNNLFFYLFLRTYWMTKWSLMSEQSKGNNYTSKINVFPVSHTIFFLLGSQKMDLFASDGAIKSTL